MEYSEIKNLIPSILERYIKDENLIGSYICYEDASFNFSIHKYSTHISLVFRDSRLPIKNRYYVLKCVYPVSTCLTDTPTLGYSSPTEECYENETLGLTVYAKAYRDIVPRRMIATKRLYENSIYNEAFVNSAVIEWREEKEKIITQYDEDTMIEETILKIPSFLEEVEKKINENDNFIKMKNGSNT